jgi:hypothetical protein
MEIELLNDYNYIRSKDKKEYERSKSPYSSSS